MNRSLKASNPTFRRVSHNSVLSQSYDQVFRLKLEGGDKDPVDQLLRHSEIEGAAQHFQR